MPADPHYCWDQTVDDGRFRCYVEQDAEGYSGVLHVVVVDTGEVLLEKDVPVAYAARFGPDISDVNEWQDQAIAVIDAWIERHAAE